MVGDLGVTLLPGVPAAPAGAKITTELELPSFLQIGGGPARARVTLNVTADGTLELEEMHIALPNLSFGGWECRTCSSTTSLTRRQVWRGQEPVLRAWPA